MNCHFCKKEMTGRKRKFCDSVCAERSRTKTGKTRKQYLLKKKFDSIRERVRKCYGCGIIFVKKKSAKHKDGESYCSRECMHKHQYQYQDNAQCALPKYSIIFNNACAECGISFLDRYKKLYCSTRCANDAKAERKRQKIATIDCNVCGVTFSRLKGNSFQSCSSDCLLEAKRIARRKAKSRRRAAKRFCDADLFDPIDVLSRDGWICQSCGCSTPETLRGTTNGNAPELDHIIPISRGGAHSMDNTQCLCRDCNQLKSNKTMDEHMSSNGMKYNERTAAQRRAIRNNGQMPLL